ncbi:hypothetical protein RHSIM_Rhsim03G0032400 [Rhododendron simsii]|uniref:Uncharacterized protein n=1 Tax=Rhododendron simsii TaxID=118357 RepID=A0A834LPJ3_RHOSS|nr:hypothetical protein RHSIM_Rhsim03G0032400 [Rhododendron simsii]
MAATGLLQYYFFPTDFLYPRCQHRIPPLLQPPKTEPVSDQDQPPPSEAAAALVLRDLHGNNNVPRRRNESAGTKNRSGGGCGVESCGGSKWEAEVLTPLHLSCPVTIPDFPQLPYGVTRFTV